MDKIQKLGTAFDLKINRNSGRYMFLNFDSQKISTMVFMPPLGSLGPTKSIRNISGPILELW